MAKVPRTRNAGTWTESQYWSAIRSGLRRQFRFWKPITQAKAEARRVYKGPNKSQKWEYQCNHCKQWFKGSEVEVDHIEPAGSLRSYEDVGEFVRKLTAEDGYQVLCKDCHRAKTLKERKK